MPTMNTECIIHTPPPRNDVATLKTITYPAIKTTGTLIVIILLPILPMAVAVAAWVVGAAVGVVYTTVTGATVAIPMEIIGE